MFIHRPPSLFPPPIFEYTSWWHFFPSLSTSFSSVLYVLCFFCESGKNQEQKLHTKGEMVMPDVICVPNNNKAIHHLNMCRCARHICDVWRSTVFLCWLPSPSANFRHYLIEKGFRCLFLCVLFSVSVFPQHFARWWCFFMPFFAERTERWCCSWAHYCSYYYSFLSLLTRRQNKSEWFTGARI